MQKVILCKICFMAKGVILLTVQWCKNPYNFAKETMFWKLLPYAMTSTTMKWREYWVDNSTCSPLVKTPKNTGDFQFNPDSIFCDRNLLEIHQSTSVSRSRLWVYNLLGGRPTYLKGISLNYRIYCIVHGQSLSYLW